MNFKNHIILGSKSPRRRQLLKLITSDFHAESIDVNEDYPTNLASEEVATYLSKKKASIYEKEFRKRIIITSDTTVILDDMILGKPASFDEGFAMLKALSGRSHIVNTAVNIMSEHKNETLSVFTTVHFPELTQEMINDYLLRFNPVDKAGAYGIQECVNKATDLYSDDESSFLNTKRKVSFEEESRRVPSFIIKEIEGSFFNVVGFPIVEVAKVLKAFI